MIKEKGWFPIFYMFVVTAGFSCVLIGFARLTSAQVEANKQLAFEQAVVSVLPIELGEGGSSSGIHQAFVQQVGRHSSESGGAYLLKKEGVIAAYALPFSGKGFWATIRGVIGIAADKKTIFGVAIYEQSETPGLGAEIAKAVFRDQFKNKVILSGEKPIRLQAVGSVLAENGVYAVTGATQTSIRLEKMINDDLKKWQKAVGGGVE